MDRSQLFFLVHGILQARILEYVTMPSSGGSYSCFLHLLHWQAGSLPVVPPGKPLPVGIILAYLTSKCGKIKFMLIL